MVLWLIHLCHLGLGDSGLCYTDRDDPRDATPSVPLSMWGGVEGSGWDRSGRSTPSIPFGDHKLDALLLDKGQHVAVDLRHVLSMDSDDAGCLPGLISGCVKVLVADLVKAEKKQWFQVTGGRLVDVHDEGHAHVDGPCPEITTGVRVILHTGPRATT